MGRFWVGVLAGALAASVGSAAPQQKNCEESRPNSFEWDGKTPIDWATRKAVPAPEKSLNCPFEPGKKSPWEVGITQGRGGQHIPKALENQPSLRKILNDDKLPCKEFPETKSDAYRCCISGYMLGLKELTAWVREKVEPECMMELDCRTAYTFGANHAVRACGVDVEPSASTQCKTPLIPYQKPSKDGKGDLVPFRFAGCYFVGLVAGEQDCGHDCNLGMGLYRAELLPQRKEIGVKASGVSTKADSTKTAPGPATSGGTPGSPAHKAGP